MAAKYFVSKLNFNTKDDDLRALFEQYGEVTLARVEKTGDGRSRGFGWVEMEIEDPHAGLDANGIELDGTVISVTLAK
jgi:RNA recognition motif-containing protein